MWKNAAPRAASADSAALPVDAAQGWSSRSRKKKCRSSVLPVPIHQVDYEMTVGDLEGTARRLVMVCGLDWDPACLDFHRTRRVVRTASYAQVRQPVYASSVGRWKHYRNELATLFAALPWATDWPA